MKVLSVVGGRPQFIKAAVVSHELRKKHSEILVHTGQHFDYNMSQLFFEEMNIPAPDYNLGISGGTHAQMTGNMMIAIEEVLQNERPDWLLVYGDMNSTLAAALAAAKLHIPICHVEAGARTHSMTNPEEINRVCTDHVSTLCLAVLPSSYEELAQESLEDRSVFTGDPMYDAFLKYRGKRNTKEMNLNLLEGGAVSLPDTFYYLTCHREENTYNDQPLSEIMRAMESLDAPTIYPVHPRNKERALRLKEKYQFHNLLLTQPVGYLESICLVCHAKKIVTDSGGLQREAFFAEKKCITVLDFCGCPEILRDGRCELAKPVTADILEKLNNPQSIDPLYRPFGDGHAAEIIVKELGKGSGGTNI